MCGEPEYCEPIAVWFTPDSSMSDSSYNYYSIKTLRFCFAGNISADTTFTIHLSDSFPDHSNLIYKQYISVDVSETNQNFLIDGIYKFKDFDVSTVTQLNNIDIKTTFWVVLQNKVWALWNTTNKDDNYYESKHSYYNGLPTMQWQRMPGDWIIEAVVEYHNLLDLENPSDKILFPNKAFLLQNYPNPFNPSTSIEFSIPSSDEVQIVVYNMTGQKIGTLLNKRMPAGNYKLEYNAHNLSSGIYFYQIQAGEFQEVKKMILLR